MGAIILEAKDVCIRKWIQYKTIKIEAGKTTFIQGQSGCGKSSLLKLFNGVLTPESGEVIYNGRNVAQWDTLELRKQVLLVAQTVYLFNSSIKENFCEFYGYREQPLPQDSELENYLSICGVEFKLNDSCDAMSGGERQRVFIAIAISFLPNVLMLDEPTSALDENTGNLLLKSLKEFCIQKEITLLIVSHDKKLMEEYADSTIVLSAKGIEVEQCREL